MSPSNPDRTETWGLSRFWAPCEAWSDENGTVPLCRMTSRIACFPLLLLAVAVLAPWAYGAEAAKVAPPSRSVLIKDIPFVLQEPDFCGEACAAMYLQKLGRRVDQDYVFNQSGLDPFFGRGCYTKELAAALTKIGFRIGPVWYPIPAQGSAQAVQAQWQAVLTDLSAGSPTIVCMYYNDQPGTTEHFRLVTGYDAAADAVIYHEPAQAAGAYRRMPRETFLKLWPLAGGGGQSTVIRLRLEPGRLLPAPPPATSFTAADYAQHIMKLKKKIPGASSPCSSSRRSWCWATIRPRRSAAGRRIPSAGRSPGSKRPISARNRGKSSTSGSSRTTPATAAIAAASSTIRPIRPTDSSRTPTGPSS